MNDALGSATQIAGLIKKGRLTAVAALEDCLDRYERFNPTINAVVVTRIEEATARAEEADAACARGEWWGLLHGVPMTIKEALDWADTPSTWGDPAWAERIPKDDAVVVQRLLAAGAVIWGKTNVPLGLADWQSFNDIYGTTNNPWDPNRTPGGSSGGSAAALATGMTALELGSDTGASIRNPAHYCGVFGLKPTWDLLPLDGHLPPGDRSSIDIAVVGPMARTADDLDLALEVLAGPADPDATAYRVELPEARQVSLDQFRVGVMLDSPCVVQDDELTDQLQTTIESLARAGVGVVDQARPAIDSARSHEVYMLLMRAAMNTHASDEQSAAAASRLADGGENLLPYEVFNPRALGLSHRGWWALHQEREQLRHAWASWFDDFDLLLCPVAASAAFPHEQRGTRASRQIPVNGGREFCTDQLFWAGLASVVYLPAVSAPAGLTRSGLPVGLQIVAPHLQDRTAIRFAQLMEREIGGFAPPPEVTGFGG